MTDNDAGFWDDNGCLIEASPEPDEENEDPTDFKKFFINRPFVANENGVVITIGPHTQFWIDSTRDNPTYVSYESMKAADIVLPEGKIPFFEDMTVEESIAYQKSKEVVAIRSTNNGNTFFYKHGQLHATIYANGAVTVWRGG